MQMLAYGLDIARGHERGKVAKIIRGVFDKLYREFIDKFPAAQLFQLFERVGSDRPDGGLVAFAGKLDVGNSRRGDLLSGGIRHQSADELDQTVRLDRAWVPR